MKKMKFLSFAMVLSFAMCLVSCGGNANKEAAATEETAAVEAVYDVDSLLASAEGIVNDTITVEAVCTHICQHGGGKIFLMGSDDKHVIRCVAGEALGSFKPECKGSIVSVKGVLVEERIDEAYVAKMEAAMKAEAGEKHGDGGAGCESDMKARKEKAAATPEERIANLRAQIAENEKATGKNYLSNYFVYALEYNIAK